MVARFSNSKDALTSNWRLFVQEWLTPFSDPKDATDAAKNAAAMILTTEGLSAVFGAVAAWLMAKPSKPQLAGHNLPSVVAVFNNTASKKWQVVVSTELCQ